MTSKKRRYPTHEQMKEVWDAWKGQGGIRESLKNVFESGKNRRGSLPSQMTASECSADSGD